ncbi:MAG: S41 family peptidase, partial [Pyrinomonadaceae bacterium]
MRKLLFLLALIFSLLIAAPYCSGQSQSLTAEIKKQTIDDLSALLVDRYAYRETGQKLQQLLQQNLKAGKYDSYNSPVEFSIAVTNDLRSLNSDKHLALNYSPQAEPTGTRTNTTTQPLTDEERARQASMFNRQMNFGFRSVQFLNGNIGYLKFDYFDSFLDYSAPVVDASMSFLKNCDAIIIDLRDNGGGSPQMVAYVTGFFLKDRTLTGTSYDRLTDTTTQEFISPQPEEKRLSDVDLYILTSKSTVSAAEALAYNLKYLKRAKVVGETSAGAANPGRVTRLNNLFTAFIPNRHGMSVLTGTNWEGTGVPVDIACPAEDALRRARIEALKKLQQKASDSLQQKRFGSYITYLAITAQEKEL